jgi:thiamine-phosphate pyrophosphorylase
VRGADLAEHLRLIAITDDRDTPEEILAAARAAVEAGAPAIQLRLKEASGRATFDLATRLLAITRPAGALLFVNDRLDVALAAGADGAHLGDDDLPVRAARAIAPPGFLIGRSVDDPAEAAEAARAGADYVGFGPIFATLTKAGLPPAQGIDAISEVRAAAGGLPVVAIGGITAGNARPLIAAGADGVAAISAISRAPDAAEAVRDLLVSASPE